MSRLIESIRLLDGEFHNLPYHEQRMNSSLGTLYGRPEKNDLHPFLVSLKYPSRGLYKCRVTYDDETRAATFLPYTIKPVKSLKVVWDNKILYAHKFSDRSSLDGLMEKRGHCDDILIIKNDAVTDTSYANIVFRDGVKWYTPSTPLLKGTMRERLIKEGKIEEQEIKWKDIRKFQKFKLINAMLGFEHAECDISSIYGLS